MKHVKLFEAFNTQSLSEEQIGWLNECTRGSWKLNPSTGLIDVDGNFYCGQQDLTDFKGVAFGHVRGYFHCHGNQIISLEGAPQAVSGFFYCNDNLLTSLEGAPQTVGDFRCNDNQITSLVGAPQTVNGYFYCNDNQITSLEGAPLTVDGKFYCDDNPVTEKTLASIFALMKNGKSYQQALEEHWPDMDDNDRILMYKDYRSLTPEEIRRYDALTTVNRIKNYL
jgi:hypothetical protein